MYIFTMIDLVVLMQMCLNASWRFFDCLGPSCPELKLMMLFFVLFFSFPAGFCICMQFVRGKEGVLLMQVF